MRGILYFALLTMAWVLVWPLGIIFSVLSTIEIQKNEICKAIRYTAKGIICGFLDIKCTMYLNLLTRDARSWILVNYRRNKLKSLRLCFTDGTTILSKRFSFETQRESSSTASRAETCLPCYIAKYYISNIC